MPLPQRTRVHGADVTVSPTLHRTTLRIASGHPAFAGEMPGVSLIAEVLEAVLDVPALAAIVGDAPRIGAVKFLAPVRPGAQLDLQLDGSARGVRFEVREGARLAASGQFEARA